MKKLLFTAVLILGMFTAQAQRVKLRAKAGVDLASAKLKLLELKVQFLIQAFL